MNGSATTATTRSTSAVLTLAWRFATLRSQGLPVIPIAILLTVTLVAIFANVLAPHNPVTGEAPRGRNVVIHECLGEQETAATPSRLLRRKTYPPDQVGSE